MRYSCKKDIFSNLTKFEIRSLQNIGKYWYKFSMNKLSVLGLIIVLIIIILAIFAPWIAPFPAHAGRFVDIKNSFKAPSLKNICGTDDVGRDVFSRIIFAFRGALIMPIIVLILSVPVGVSLGLIAGYFKENFIGIIIMRITDIFVSIPAFLLALAIVGVLKPNLLNSMLAVSITWWAVFARMVFGMVSSIKNENFVVASELMGANRYHILFKEILPNCLSPIFTKMALDIGWVILIGASLGFLGLGQQPPTPALGQMVSDGSTYMPMYWWMSVFPGIAIAITILGFNLTGDGIKEMFKKEVE